MNINDIIEVEAAMIPAVPRQLAIPEREAQSVDPELIALADALMANGGAAIPEQPQPRAIITRGHLSLVASAA